MRYVHKVRCDRHRLAPDFPAVKIEGDGHERSFPHEDEVPGPKVAAVGRILHHNAPLSRPEIEKRQARLKHVPMSDDREQHVTAVGKPMGKAMAVLLPGLVRNGQDLDLAA